MKYILMFLSSVLMYQNLENSGYKNINYQSTYMHVFIKIFIPLIIFLYLYIFNTIYC